MTTSYCPYCNTTAAVELTDEHVVPESIGGDSRTVIRVCKPCNNTIGGNVDALLSGDGWMRMNGLYAGAVAKRQDRLETTTTLKDGRKLEGQFYFIPTDKGVRHGFEPKKHQPDGTTWLSEEVETDFDSLPANINVFRRDMVEYWGYYFPPARSSGMEPAMLKILLGIIFLDQGQTVVASSAFNVIRSSLGGTVHPDITFTWLDKPMRWEDSTVRNHEHAVYFECTDGSLFRGGVALFGTGIKFKISNFNCILPRRCVRWDGRLAPLPERPRENAS